MMKRYFTPLLLLLCLNWAFGQVLTVKPDFPTADGEITLTFDVSKSQHPNKGGLLNQTAGLYVWTWGGADPANKTAEFSPSGQTAFSQPFAPGLLTRVSADVWSIKLTPNKYIAVPAGKTLRWVGILVKNASGSAQTEDFVFDLFLPNQLFARFDAPLEKNFFVDANTSIPTKVKVSTKSQLTISLDGTTIATANDTTLSTNVLTGNLPNQRRTVRLSATNGTQTATDEFSFTVSPTPRLAALPAGLKNGINYTSNSSATLVLFAPEKKFIYLLGDFNNWENQPDFLMNRTPDGQTYWLEIKNLTPQKEYAFQYLVDGVIAVGDPYCEKILDRNNDRFIANALYPNLMPFPTKAQGNVVSVLQTAQTPYPWKINNFKRPDADNLVIYELHVRDFVGTQWYKTVSDSLNYLKKLGVNAIELMPIMEFSGNDSWGYNPIYYVAPDKAYGTANDLKAFIDKCHENGIAVLLDMVLNQADYEFPYVKMYWDGTQPAKNNPMFNQQATHPFSVFFDFNHEAAATKNYVQRVNDFWLKEYRFDGFRFDLSKGFTQRDAKGDVSQWGRYDASRVAIWKRIYDQIRQTDPTAYVILEHFAEDPEESELTNYGMMVWDNQNGGFREMLKTSRGDVNRLSWKNHAGFQRAASIGYMESHDEERLIFDAVTNGSAAGNYTVKDLPTALERAKAAAALFFLTPGPKMLWQFGELGYDVPINFQNDRTGRKPIRWNYLQDPNRLKLYKVYAELIKLKTTQAAFRSVDFSLEAGISEVKRLTINNAALKVEVVTNMNLAEKVLALPIGKWFDFFTGQEINVLSNDPIYAFKAGEFHVLTSVKLATPEPNLVPWTLQIITANDPILGESTMIVFPNPAQDQLIIAWESNYRGNATVELLNGLGQKMKAISFLKTEQKANQMVNVAAYSAGFYVVKIIENERVQSKKWVKK